MQSSVTDNICDPLNRLIIFCSLVDHAGQKSLQHASTDETNESKPSELGVLGPPTAHSAYKAAR